MRITAKILLLLASTWAWQTHADPQRHAAKASLVEHGPAIFTPGRNSDRPAPPPRESGGEEPECE